MVSEVSEVPDGRASSDFREPYADAHGPLTVWGGGYVGLSTAMHFATHGIRTVIRDTSARRVCSINAGHADLPLFEDWIGITLAPLVRNELITAINAYDDIDPAHRTHFVAVPTERDGRPWLGAIEDVFRLLRAVRPHLCVIESTCPPGTSERLFLEHGFPIAVAPRRDWFLGAGKDLATLPRVYGAVSRSVADTAHQLLKIVSSDLRRATTCTEAELAKCLENSIHHVVAQYVTQVSRAYSGNNVNEALALAATHWRMGTTYYAAAGTGGYCVPVSTAFLLAGTVNNQVLSIGREALRFGHDQRTCVANTLAQASAGRVAILGVAYRGDVPSMTLSPFVAIAGILLAQGVHVAIHDSYFSAPALAGLLGGTSLEYPHGLSECGAVLVGPNHKQYRALTPADVTRYFVPGQTVLANEGCWEHLREAFYANGISYKRIGDALWTTL